MFSFHPKVGGPSYSLFRIDGFNYYVYLLDAHKTLSIDKECRSVLAKWWKKKIVAFSKDIGPEAVAVDVPAIWNKELATYMATHMYRKAKSEEKNMYVSELFQGDGFGMIITDKPIQNAETVICIKLLPRAITHFSRVEELMRQVATCIKQGVFQELIEHIGSYDGDPIVSINSVSKENVKLKAAEHLEFGNDVIILQPNLFGFGLDLNKLLKKISEKLAKNG